MISNGSSVALLMRCGLTCFSYGVTLVVNDFQGSPKKMVHGVARLVKMCKNRSRFDELMVILDGTTMFAKAFE